MLFWDGTSDSNWKHVAVSQSLIYALVKFFNFFFFLRRTHTEGYRNGVHRNTFSPIFTSADVTNGGPVQRKSLEISRFFLKSNQLLLSTSDGTGPDESRGLWNRWHHTETVPSISETPLLIWRETAMETRLATCLQFLRRRSLSVRLPPLSALTSPESGARVPRGQTRVTPPHRGGGDIMRRPFLIRSVAAVPPRCLPVAPLESKPQEDRVSVGEEGGGPAVGGGPSDVALVYH